RSIGRDWRIARRRARPAARLDVPGYQSRRGLRAERYRMARNRRHSDASGVDVARPRDRGDRTRRARPFAVEHESRADDALVPRITQEPGQRGASRYRGGKDQWAGADVLGDGRSDVAVAESGRYGGAADEFARLSASVRTRQLCGRWTLHPVPVLSGNHRDLSSADEADDGAGRIAARQSRRQPELLASLPVVPGAVPWLTEAATLRHRAAWRARKDPPAWWCRRASGLRKRSD